MRSQYRNVSEFCTSLFLTLLSFFPKGKSVGLIGLQISRYTPCTWNSAKPPLLPGSVNSAAFQFLRPAHLPSF